MALVTMGCAEACPVVPWLRRMDWPLEDAKGKPIERVREIRDAARARVTALLAEERLGKVIAMCDRAREQCLAIQDAEMIRSPGSSQRLSSLGPLFGAPTL